MNTKPVLVIVRALHMEEAMSEWKPIETAPNELDILIAYDDGTIKAIEAEENDYEWQPYRGHKIDGLTSPTHWMPLPSPPK